ncbi:MAG: hypothetical protein CMJ31_12285 [Phycisphaerae bacterium]|nr:hypothetical protein [Phycisphaerae bacterium]
MAILGCIGLVSAGVFYGVQSGYARWSILPPNARLRAIPLHREGITVSLMADATEQRLSRQQLASLLATIADRLNDPDFAVNERAASRLAALTTSRTKAGDPFLPMHWPDPACRAIALRSASGSLPSSLPFLLAYLSTSDPSCFVAAATCLSTRDVSWSEINRAFRLQRDLASGGADVRPLPAEFLWATPNDLPVTIPSFTVAAAASRAALARLVTACDQASGSTAAERITAEELRDIAAGLTDPIILPPESHRLDERAMSCLNDGPFVIDQLIILRQDQSLVIDDTPFRRKLIEFWVRR